MGFSGEVFPREQWAQWRFLAALESAGITKELTGAGPFTVLAPTDGAIDEFNGEITPDVLK